MTLWNVAGNMVVERIVECPDHLGVRFWVGLDLVKHRRQGVQLKSRSTGAGERGSGRFEQHSHCQAIEVILETDNPDGENAFFVSDKQPLAFETSQSMPHG